MIEINLKINDLDLNSLIEKSLPLIINNKVTSKAMTFCAISLLKSMNEEEKYNFIIKTLCNNKTKIIELLNSYVKGKGIIGKVSDFNVIYK